MRLSKASLSEQTIINPNTRTRKKQRANSIITVVKTLAVLISCTITFLVYRIIIRKLPLFRVLTIRVQMNRDVAAP
jgi:cell division septal protein FtsQ